jgi:hypothetical protein
MNESAFIALKIKDQYKGIYCHNKGYPEHAGKILYKNYNNEEKIKKLIELGDIVHLDKSIDQPKEEDLSKNPIPGYTISYHRDYKEKWEECSPIRFQDKKSLIEYIKLDSNTKYIYVFENNEWEFTEIIEQTIENTKKLKTVLKK